MKPLAGVRVVELGSVVSGPYAGMLLADLGADVVKVESPAGDITRTFDPHHEGVSAYFHNFNRGKRSIVLDLLTDDGKRLARELVARADVVTENWRPGVAQRLGLGPRSLREVNPRIITVSIRGYGEEGPYAADRVYDPIIQGVSGMAAIQGGMGRPDFIRTILPDKLASMCAVQGVLAALHQRHVTGEGTHVQVSMLDAAITFQWPDTMLALTFPDAPSAEAAKWDEPAPRSAAVVRAGDGKALAYTAVSPVEWRAVCDVVGRPEWVDRYPTLHHRVVHKEEISAELERLFADQTRDEAVELFREAGIPCGPAHGPPDVLDDPQVRHNRCVVEIDRPDLGRVRQVGPLVRVGTDEWQPPPPAPALGAHTDEVLAELGYGGEEVGRLRRADVVR